MRLLQEDPANYFSDTTSFSDKNHELRGQEESLHLDFRKTF